MYMVIIFAVFGLIFGSFVNAFVWRFKKHKNWVSERSICPSCKHQLAGKDLVPVLSWLMLKGKCRYCHKPISAQYPAVELLTASLFALSYSFWPYGLTLIGWLALATWLGCIVLLVALLVYDAKWMLLPNKMVFVLTVLASILVVILSIQSYSWQNLLLSILAGVVFFGLFWLLFTLSKGKWIGGGDVKLALSLGLIVGTVINVFLVIFLASLFGTVMILPLLATKKLNQKAKISFGPFLIIATIVVFLFGKQIIAWYIKTFLYI